VLQEPGDQVTVTVGQDTVKVSASADDPPWDREPVPVFDLPDEPVVPSRLAAEKPAEKKPKKILIRDMTADQVYAAVEERGKVTPSLQARLKEIEDFSQLSPRWCEKICQAPCGKNPNTTVRGDADIVILTSVKSSGSRFKTGDEEDKKRIEVWSFIANRVAPDLRIKVVYGMICRPEFPDGTPEKDRKVSMSKIKPCFAYQEHYLRTHRPKVIIATSAADLGLLGIKVSMNKGLSSIQEWNGIPVVVTLNVAQTMMIRQNQQGGRWGVDMFFLIQKDLEKAARIARGEFNPVGRSPVDVMNWMRSTGQLKVLDTLQKVREFCMHAASLPANKMLTFDIESTGLDPWAEDARILTIQFGLTVNGRSDGFVVPLWHRDNRFYNPDDAWTLVAMVLTADVSKAGHDGRFDIRYIQVTTGVRVRNYRLDTLLLLHSRSSGLQKCYGLKKAVWDEIPESGLGGYDDVIVEKTPEEALEDDPEDLADNPLEEPIEAAQS